MFYTIYKITNLIDGKVYIGSHKTKDLNDNYMGSGKYLKRAQEKYGIENFKKEILFVFETADEMYAKETEIVNEDFLATENTYNLRLGGQGGFDYINKNRLNGFCNPEVAKRGRESTNKILEEKYGADWRKIISTIAVEASKTPEARAKAKAKCKETKLKNGTFGKVDQMNTGCAREKKKQSLQRIGHQQGDKNSQYGTRWIHSLDQKISKKIPKENSLPEGWSEGRKINF